MPRKREYNTIWNRGSRHVALSSRVCVCVSTRKLDPESGPKLRPYDGERNKANMPDYNFYLKKLLQHFLKILEELFRKSDNYQLQNLQFYWNNNQKYNQ